MKTIDDLLNNLPETENNVPGKDGTTFQIELSEDFKTFMDKDCISTIDLMKEYQYAYMQSMHKLQVEIAKIYGMSKTREGEIKKM